MPLNVTFFTLYIQLYFANYQKVKDVVVFASQSLNINHFIIEIIKMLTKFISNYLYNNKLNEIFKFLSCVKGSNVT